MFILLFLFIDFKYIFVSGILWQYSLREVKKVKTLKHAVV